MDHCKQLVDSLNLGERVEFLGYVPQHQMLDYFRDASVVVMPSVWPEPFGTVGLEAMRQGLPVVAFDVGGISDWLRHEETGYLVPWMDQDRLVSSISRLLQDKQLAQKLGEQGRNFASSQFDYKQRLDELVDILKGIAAS